MAPRTPPLTTTAPAPAEPVQPVQPLQPVEPQPTQATIPPNKYEARFKEYSDAIKFADTESRFGIDIGLRVNSLKFGVRGRTPAQPAVLESVYYRNENALTETDGPPPPPMSDLGTGGTGPDSKPIPRENLSLPNKEDLVYSDVIVPEAPLIQKDMALIAPTVDFRVNQWKFGKGGTLDLSASFHPLDFGVIDQNNFVLGPGAECEVQYSPLDWLTITSSFGTGYMFVKTEQRDIHAAQVQFMLGVQGTIPQIKTGLQPNYAVRWLSGVDEMNVNSGGGKITSRRLYSYPSEEQRLKENMNNFTSAKTYIDNAAEKLAAVIVTLKTLEKACSKHEDSGPGDAGFMSPGTVLQKYNQLESAEVRLKEVKKMVDRALESVEDVSEDRAIIEKHREKRGVTDEAIDRVKKVAVLTRTRLDALNEKMTTPPAAPTAPVQPTQPVEPVQPIQPEEPTPTTQPGRLNADPFADQ